MTDVFISYARSSEEQAKRVEHALRATGFAVWRDAELPAHGTYADVIEERLNAARAVVVLWTADAAKSQWVRAEADAARSLGTLIQASVDGATPPMPFNQIHCADLKGWDGDEEHTGWRKLRGSVEALVGERREGPASANLQRRKNGICVLPFANMSGDPEQEYFSDGISEDITTDLSKVSALAVIARNTAFMFKGQSADVTDIARKLGVSHVLEGSVRKASNRVRITAQLIDGATGKHVWADRYDRDLTDIFEIQDEISKAIVEALKLKLLPKEKKAIEDRGTSSAEAYNLYLMARNHWITGNHGDRRREERVIRICQRSVELDPNYARAWALMALSEANLRFGYGGDGDGGLAAADRALLLDPTIAEAHAVKARVCSEQGDADGASSEIAEALQLAPESWEVHKEAARLCMAQKRFPDALLHFEKAVLLVEGDYHSWAMVATCCRATGDEQGLRRAAQMMVTESERVLEQDPSNGSALGVVAGGWAILGEPDRAKQWIDRALLIDPDNLNMRYNFACVLATYTKEVDAAIDLLASALPRAGVVLVNVAAVDPDIDALRGEPRFQEMLAAAQERVGIRSAARATYPPAS